MKTIRNLVACPVLALVSVIATAQEAPDRTIQIEIGQQPMVDALNGWAKQTGLQLIVPESEGADRFMAVGVNGKFTPTKALESLLLGTSLTYQFVNDRTVVIRNSEKPRHIANADRSGDEPGAFLLMADRDTDEESSKREERRGGGYTRNDSEEKAWRRSNIEEVIVSAQKREESLQDVPISISVLSGVDLDRSTVGGLTEALSRVPGVSATVPLNGGGTQLTVRGVTAAGPLFFGSSPIAYYLDSVPFAFVRSATVPDSNAYDLGQVEVLRGPQGTLYGSSALNGVVRVLTKDADLGRYEFKGRTSVSTTHGGGESYRGDAAINAPIIPGKLAARAVVGYQDMGGWIDRANQEDVNDAQIRNMRLKVNAQPTEELSIGLSAWISRSDYGAPSVSAEGERTRAILDESIVADYDAYGLKLVYDLSSFSITSLTGYLNYETQSFIDIGVFGFANTRAETRPDAKVRSQEIILSSSTERVWRWSVGGMYRDVDDHLFQDQRDSAGVPIRTAFRLAPTDQTFSSESIAVFGELTRKIMEGRFEVTAGFRYFEDDVELKESSRVSGVPASQLVRSTDKFDAVTPRLVLTWLPRPDLTIYGSYAEGFRSGLQQQPNVLIVAPDFQSADPDELKNYELGLKSNLLGGRLSLDSAVYFVDWKNVQQSLLVFVAPGVRSAAIVNGESASGVGAEFSATARPVDRLDLSLNASWNDLTLDKDVFSGGTLVFAKDTRINTSPEYTLGASAGYTFPLGANGFEGVFSASLNHTSGMVASRTISRDVIYADSISIGRTSFSIESPQRWTATLYVDNVNNERSSPVPANPADWSLRIRPRTIGAQLEYHFDK